MAEMRLTEALDTSKKKVPSLSNYLSASFVPFIDRTNRRIAGKEEMQFAEPPPPISQNWDIIVNNCHHELTTSNLKPRVYQKDLLEETNSAIISG